MRKRLRDFSLCFIYLSLPHRSVFLPLSFVSLSLISSLLSISPSFSFHFISRSLCPTPFSFSQCLFPFCLSICLSTFYLSSSLSLSLSLYSSAITLDHHHLYYSIVQLSLSLSVCSHFVLSCSRYKRGLHAIFSPSSLSLSQPCSCHLSLSPTVSTRPFAPLQLQSQEGEREEWERHK